MKGLNIYIVEDEPLISETIKTILIEGGYDVCGESDNAKEAIFDIELLQPDLVLADIMIEGELDGVDMVKHLNNKMAIPIIFLTSLSDPETLQRVKDCNPSGFIVKPFNENNLITNIELAMHKHNLSNPSVSVSPKSEDFFIKNKGELIKIEQDKILYFEADGNYTTMFTTERKHLITHTLKHIEEKLPKSKFIRVHRSYIINFAKISSLQEGYVFIERHKVPVSRSSKEDLMKSLNLL